MTAYRSGDQEQHPRKTVVLIHKVLLVRQRVAVALGLASMLTVAACGGGGGGGNSSPAATPSNQAPSVDNAYFPLHSGDRWLYDLSVRNGSSSATSSRFEVAVGSTSNTAGSQRTTLLTTALDGTVYDEMAYASTTEGVTAFPTSGSDYAQAIGPFTVLQQASPAPGTSFVQVDKTVDGGTDADGDGIHEQVVVRAVVEVVDRAPLTVAAGRFAEVLHLRTTISETIVYSRSSYRPVYRTVQDDWYGAGVGLVRSDNTQSVDGTVLSSSGSTLRSYRVGGAHAGVAAQVATVTPDDVLVHNGGVAIQAIFDTPMNQDSLNGGGFTVRDGNGLLIGGNTVVSPDGLTSVFVPAGGWHSGTFTASINATAVDRYDNAATPRSWTFTLDTVAPTLAIATPPDGATNVPTNTVLNYVFSEQIDTGSVMSAGLPLFTLTDDSTGAQASAIVSYDSVSTVSLRPRNSYWPHATRYTLTFPAGTADLLGNTVGHPIEIHFSTAPGAFGAPVDVGMTRGVSVRPMVADLDGDGHEDLLWAAWDNQTFPWTMHFTLRRGQAGGGWGPAIQPFPDSVYPCAVMSITHGDINGDGRQDLVIGGMCALQVLFQQPDGTFTAGPRYTPAGMEAGQYAALADLNGDGRTDMVSTGNATGFQIWLQDPGGQLIYTSTYDGTDGIGAPYLIDLDGDGRLDMVGQGGPRVYWGHGDGSFSAAQSIGPVTMTSQYAPQYLTFGDVDQDGRLDVVASTFDGSTGQSLTQVFRQTASRTFAAPWQSAETPKPAIGITLMDTNSDGRLDAVTGYWDAFSVRLGSADGTFGEEDFYDATPTDLSGAFMEHGLLDSQRRALLLCNGQLYVPLASTASSGGAAVASISVRRTANGQRVLSTPAEAFRPPKTLTRSPVYGLSPVR